MKKLIISLLALSALAGGSLSASAASGVTYTAVNIDVGFTNISIWSVDGAVQTTGPQAENIENLTFASTDGTGKVIGGGLLRINYATNDFSGKTVPLSTLYCDISGKVSSTTSKGVSVTLQIKGDGYTVQDHTTAQTGTPLTANLKFTSSSVTSSNITGTLSGTLTGNTPLGQKNAKINNLPVVLRASVNQLAMSWDILEATKGSSPLWSVDNYQTSGTASANKNGFTANLKGIAFDKGVTMQITGTTGTYTNGVAGTNTGISYTAPVQPITLKKASIQGQAVSGSSTSVSATLLH